jgi:C1A family cysteine protease
MLEFTPLKAMKDTYEPLVDVLKKNAVRDLESLVLYGNIPSARKALIERLQMKQSEFDQMLRHAHRVVGHRTEWTTPLDDSVVKRFRFGVRLRDARLRRQYEGLVHKQVFSQTAPLPDAVSHVDAMMPIRHQGKRGTCVAFGTVAAAEFSFRPMERFSEQFVYWVAKQRDFDPDIEGSTVEAGVSGLRDAGVCYHSQWPYCSEPCPGNEHQGPPPENARISALNCRSSGYVDLTNADLDDLKAALAGGTDRDPAIIVAGFIVYDSWYKNPLVYKTGEFTPPIPGEEPQGGHCMAIVGYSDHQDEQRFPGGGYFVVRNSWGTEWAADSEESSGYGRIPYSMINNGLIIEAYMIKTRTDRFQKTAETHSEDRLERLKKRLNMNRL